MLRDGEEVLQFVRDKKIILLGEGGKTSGWAQWVDQLSRKLHGAYGSAHDPSQIDRSKFSATCDSAEVMHLSGSSDPARFELSPYKEPAGTDRNAIRYLKERVAKQQRVIDALQETPMLPKAVLRPPAPRKDKRPRAIIEQGQGSYESRKLLEAKKAKREKKEASAREKKDKDERMKTT